jgi:hypothetical protein
MCPAALPMSITRSQHDESGFPCPTPSPAGGLGELLAAEPIPGILFEGVQREQVLAQHALL